MKQRKLLIIAGLALAAVAGSALACPDGGDRGKRRGAPQVAIDACASAVEGDVCSFESRRGDAMNGTCAIPHGEQLVCFPEGGHHKGGKRDRDADSTTS